MKYWFLNHIGVPLSSMAFRLMFTTIRSRWVDRSAIEGFYKRQQSFICAFWHCDLLSIASLGRKENNLNKIFIMTSLSRDGEMLSRFLRRHGFGIIRGSSSRGAVSGMVNLKKCLEGGSNIAIAVDGPRGPRLKVKAGAILLAKATGVPILPIAIRLSKKKVLHSWDRCEVPLPFSRCELYSSDSPVHIPPNAGKEEIERKRMEVEERLLNLKGENHHGPTR